MDKEKRKHLQNFIQTIAEYAATLSTITILMTLNSRSDWYDAEALAEHVTMIERRAAWIADEVAAFRRLQSQSN